MEVRRLAFSNSRSSSSSGSLCRPEHLIASNEEVAQKITERIENSPCPLDLEVVEKRASDDVVAAREEALDKKLAEMKKRKRKLVDPLQFEMSIQAEDKKYRWGKEATGGRKWN